MTTKEESTWPFPQSKHPRGFVSGWSPNGRFLAFGSYGVGENYGLWIVDSVRQKVKPLLGGDVTAPCWSPDGAHLAVEVRSGQGEVWVIDLPMSFRDASESRAPSQ